ncbi:MAG: FkbM family methyltransferase, partial [Gammaproteobacteria bacterium]|nr:FkbM family methyltransferase [Gammaproteobacteria bacterium]
MITYHHIGGRNGTSSVPLTGAKFLQDFHLVFYDADENCIEQIRKSEKSDFGKVTVCPYCIGKQTQSAAFNINFHPTTSSLYDFNPAFKDYTTIANSFYGGYQFGEACQTIKKVKLDLLSLEEALSKSQITTMDFLSLDIQGAEYDVLSGSRKLIQENCVGIQLEVEFVELYKNQKLFPEINQLLDNMGFELIDLNSFGRASPSPVTIGFRGLEQLLYAEAIYVKKFSKLKKTNNIAKLYKWALFCLINQKIGLCLKALERLAEIDDMQEPTKNPQYILLLKKIWTLFKAQQKNTLPSIGEVISEQMLQGYYQGIANDSEKFITDRESIREQLSRKYLPNLKAIKKLSETPDSDFELLLRQYGLDTVANTVKQNRHKDTKT